MRRIHLARGLGRHTPGKHVTRHFKLKKGLDLPIDGAPEQVIHDGPEIQRVAVIGHDYVGMKPTMLVTEGETVACGQPLFEDKKNPGVLFTAPAGGVVEAINRGNKRVLQSVVIRIEGNDAVEFNAYSAAELGTLEGDVVRDQLVQSGLWTAFRTRPYSKSPAVGSSPRSIFVTAMDSNPLAADPAVIIAEQSEAFKNGLAVLKRLTDGPVFVCQRPGVTLPHSDDAQVQTATFEGPHPSGLPGTHIHYLDPAGVGRTVWHVGYQDVIAIGKLFTEGRLYTDRVVAIAGPPVAKPRLIRTRLGACIEAIIEPETIEDVDCRPISGSVWNGRRASGWAAYLGRFHTQITFVAEARKRQLFGWVRPGGDKFSVMNVFFSALQRGSRRFAFSTAENGSPRAMVPIGNYEKVMPLDVLATQLLRAIVVRDTDSAQQLGCLELDEEDLALCSFVCVGKYDFGPHLRASLEQIEVEG
ncbi:MAG: NADH:ubiquinone reductase (Na(+)-transporting) subunit A [Nevskiales bacterium]|mgnify:CR=1 FL=1|nr:NADH:ubiquinone reductase (Na(+)-transporting) subunit A [Nevskiales bacterium]